MKDKRDECGCHRECTTSIDPHVRLDHVCSNPCRWPDCLTEDEHQQLLAALKDHD